MRLFQFDDMKTLVERRQWPCISLCLPTHRAGKDRRGDPIRLKNAVGTARERLIEIGYPKDRVAELLAPAGDLVTSRDFWLHQADGLAVFLAPGLFRYYRVPLKLQDDVVVADHFSLKQLAPLLTESGRFYVLAFSRNQIRFFDATRTSIHEREVPDMLKSINDLRQFDDVEEQLQGHTMPMAQGGKADIMFHGQGNAADMAAYKADMARYLTAVSRRLEKYLNTETTPLILAAVEYEQSLYRQVNSYHHLLEEGIVGNPDDLGEEQIHQAAWKIVEPHFAEARGIELRHFADLSRTDKTSDRLEDILPAAFHGRVRTLFVRHNACVWGRFDAESLSVETHDGPDEEDVDLIDLAIIHVLQNRGAVYALQDQEMPTTRAQAAILRY
jgi:hypothetical protein